MGEFRTKSRTWLDGTVSGSTRSSIFAAWTPYHDDGPLSRETITGKTNSPMDGGRWSGGGPMWLDRDTKLFTPSPAKLRKLSGGGSPLAEGTMRIEGPTSAVPDLAMPSVPSDSQLNADGTTAISRVEPTSPAFDLSVTLGELRMEGIPSIPGHTVMEQTRLAKKAGGEYLNVEFGWLPLVRGVRDFATAVQNADEILRSYQEHANIPIKRRYDFPIVSSTRFDTCNFSMMPAVGFFTGGGRYQSVKQQKWFEAEFIYYLPTGGSTNDKFRRYGSYARKLLGVRLTPEVLWNLSPWSWAVDWFSNVGDVMHNISAIGTDGMVMRYGYMMCHTQKITIDHGTAFGVAQTKTSTREFKTRLGATPYGFGVSFGSLSPKQMAITAALGLSRW